MKIQYIAVVFVIIILPIAMVMSSYIGTQIDTITLQTKYDTKLTEATYDAIKAFQINTVNNRYSTISDSKIRDIEASISTFYNSLSNNEYMTKEELQLFVPSLVYTLYDGYYIYTKYDNMYPEKAGKIYTDPNETNANYGLRPYIYYTCRYRKGEATEFVVNYTLDNAITIYGTFNRTYRTLSGYLINPDSVKPLVYEEIDSNPMNWRLTYDIHGKHNDGDTVTIGPELLTEHLLFANGEQGDYDYLTYNGQKIYYDKAKDKDGNDGNCYFTYQNYAKQYIIGSSNSNTELNTYLKKRTSGKRLYSTSAFEYYYDAKKFSEDVAKLTKDITQANAIDEKGEKVEFEVDTEGEDIFVTSVNNDPLMSGSTFNENRMQVIKNSIESNLVAAIANYKMYSTNNYVFSLPELKETDWEKITNNVSVISFLQGLPIGYKYYNNYCVLTNNSNEETIKKENIYIITQNLTSKEREYHLVGCKHLLDETNTDDIVTAYSNLSFLRQTVRIAEGDYRYFYPQNINNEKITSCYNCIVNSTDVYTTDQILKGKITEKNIDTGEEEQKFDTGNERFKKVRELYIKALARERNDLYQANMNLMNQVQEEYTDEITDENSVIIEGTTHEMKKVDTQPLRAKIVLGYVSATWSSDRPDIVQVDENGSVRAIKEGTATITAKYEGYNDGKYQITVVEEKVTEIKLSPPEIIIKPGENEQIEASITPSNATNKKINWSSSDESIVKVDNNGKITAIKGGIATITASSEDGGASKGCLVTVVQSATGIKIEPSKVELEIGETKDLKAIVTPDNVSNKDVEWSCTNISIATVDENGKVTARHLGTVKIVAKTKDGSNKTAECEVTIVQKAKSLALNATNIKLNVDKTYKLVATVKPTNTSNQNISWSSSDKSIATVDANGKVTAKGVGTATITAKTNDGSNLSATCKVTVISLVKSITLNATSITLYRNDTYALKATVTPSDAIDKSVTWSSSNTNIATVDKNGKVTAKKLGTATITVKTNDGSNLSATCKVTVKPRLVTNLAISPKYVTMMKGETTNLTVTITPDNADNKKIKWTSDNESIATVDQNGKVTAVNEGTTYINAIAQDDSKKETWCRIEVKPDLGLKIYTDGQYVRVDCKNYYMTYAFDDDNKCRHTSMQGTYAGSLDAWQYYYDNDYQWFNKYHSNSLYIYNPIKFKKCSSHDNRAIVYIYEKKKTYVEEYGPPYYYHLTIAKIVINYKKGAYDGKDFMYDIIWYI